MKFLSRIRLLYRIVLAQLATRIILRAAWLGGAVYLISWGVNSLWGVLPQSNYWILFAAIVSFGTLATLFFKPRSQKEFLWRVDDKFELKEQVSTAYQVSKDKKGKSGGEQPLERMLVEDANNLMPDVTRKVIDKGWGIRNDVEATVIVLMMLLIVYLSGIEAFSTAIPGSGLGILPGLGSDPSFNDVFSSGIPGDTSGRSSGLGLGGQATDLVQGPQDLSADGLELVYDVFQEMGEELKDNAATSELGEELADRDFKRAAHEMGNLSENIDRMTRETRQDLAEKFSEAVRKLYLTQFSEITEILGSASEALRGTSTSEMSDQLDRVSALLQHLSEMEAKEVIAREEPEPVTPQFEEIEGEDEGLDFETAEDISEFLIAPGTGDVTSGQVEDGEVDLEGYTLGFGADGVWSLFDYLWEDKDVVSSYFKPR